MSCLLQLFYLSTLAHEPLLIIYNIKKISHHHRVYPLLSQAVAKYEWKDYCISEVVHKNRAWNYSFYAMILLVSSTTPLHLFYASKMVNEAQLHLRGVIMLWNGAWFVLVDIQNQAFICKSTIKIVLIEICWVFVCCLHQVNITVKWHFTFSMIMKMYMSQNYISVVSNEL